MHLPISRNVIPEDVIIFKQQTIFKISLACILDPLGAVWYRETLMFKYTNSARFFCLFFFFFLSLILPTSSSHFDGRSMSGFGRSCLNFIHLFGKKKQERSRAGTESALSFDSFYRLDIIPYTNVDIHFETATHPTWSALPFYLSVNLRQQLIIMNSCMYYVFQFYSSFLLWFHIIYSRNT